MIQSPTAGPWEVGHAGCGSAAGFVIDEYFVINRSVADDVAIAADIIDPVTGKPSEANARLIAESPELLALLVESQRSIGGDWRERRDLAIARATGAAP